MPLRHVAHTVQSVSRSTACAFVAAALLALTAVVPGAEAASPHAPGRASGSLPACTAQTVVIGTMPDLRTVTVTLLDGSTGTIARTGALVAGRLPAEIEAIAALDTKTFVAVDRTGALRLGTLKGSWQRGFFMTSTVLSTGWNADQLVYDGAGHLFAVSGTRMWRYSVHTDGRTVTVGPAQIVAGRYDVESLFAVGSDQLVAVSAIPSGTGYTPIARAKAKWTLDTIEVPPPGTPGQLAVTSRDLGTSRAYRNVLPAAAGSFFVQTAAGALLQASLPLDAVAPSPTPEEQARIAQLPGNAGNDLVRGNGQAAAGHAGPSIAAAAADSGWTQPLLSAAPSGCGGTIPGPNDAQRTVGQIRTFNGFVDGWCTEGAAAMFEAASGYWMSIHGNAWKWARAATDAGWKVSATPQVNSVVVFQPNVQFSRGIAAGALGHVAWVDEVVTGSDGKVWFHLWEMNGPAGRGAWDQVWATYDPTRSSTTGEPKMQFVLAPYVAAPYIAAPYQPAPSVPGPYQPAPSLPKTRPARP